MTHYWFATRPKNVEHLHLYLVFDTQDRLHFPLTRFAKEACTRLDPKTVQIYLYQLSPYFTWLDTNVWQVRMGQTWDASPEVVRRSVDDYLVQKLQCQLIPHHQGWKYVALTAGTKSTLRIFLAALKMYYQIMREQKLYHFANPLVDCMSATIAAAIAHVEYENNEKKTPPMPAKSGVEAPPQKPKHRLTDSFYKLEHDDWHPQIIDDPKLPGDILAGGRKLSLKHTRQRDEVVTFLLFETGARVSEICGLMLADWAVLGTKTKAKAFSKGSYGRRIKTISFAEETVILLQRYFDQERVHFDPHGYPLDLYLELAARKQVDLSTIPLFLSQQGTQFTPKEYREHYWHPACAAAGIEVDVHQARHWHVTREVRDIYETAKNAKEVEQRMRDLVDYMKWKSEETLTVYEHYFEQQHNDDRRADLQQRMHAEVQQHLEERMRGKARKQVRRQAKDESSPTQAVPMLDDEPDLNFLYSLAGER